MEVREVTVARRKGLSQVFIGMSWPRLTSEDASTGNGRIGVALHDPEAGQVMQLLEVRFPYRVLEGRFGDDNDASFKQEANYLEENRQRGSG